MIEMENVAARPARQARPDRRIAACGRTPPWTATTRLASATSIRHPRSSMDWRSIHPVDAARTWPSWVRAVPRRLVERWRQDQRTGWSSPARSSCPVSRSASTAPRTPRPLSARRHVRRDRRRATTNPGPRAHQRLRDEIRRQGRRAHQRALIRPLQPARARFPERNRIIAALGDATIVVEAPRKSGALNTAKHAMNLGRPVFVAPGRLGDWSVAGSLPLLRDTPARPLVGARRADRGSGLFRAPPQERWRNRQRRSSRACAADARRHRTGRRRAPVRWTGRPRPAGRRDRPGRRPLYPAP